MRWELGKFATWEASKSEWALDKGEKSKRLLLLLFLCFGFCLCLFDMKEMTGLLVAIRWDHSHRMRQARTSAMLWAGEICENEFRDGGSGRDVDNASMQMKETQNVWTQMVPGSSERSQGCKVVYEGERMDWEVHTISMATRKPHLKLVAMNI